MDIFTTENEFGRGTVKSWASILDEGTRLQAEMTSRSPVIDGHLALMPDAHFGMGATVGTVMRMKGGLIPAAIGVDIGCGMMAVGTDIERAAVTAEQERRILGRLRDTIPSGVGRNHEAPISEYADFLNALGGPKFTLVNKGGRLLADIAAVQFGTLGSGNHFAEFASDDHGNVWAIVHSGSRALGMAIAERWCAEAQNVAKEEGLPVEHRDLSYLPKGHSAHDSYLIEMAYAQNYAWKQREAMMERMMDALAAEIPHFGTGIMQVHCHHNYAHWDGEVFTARKGAIAAGGNDWGIIPGSMGDSTFIVRGKGLAEAYNSAPHGAGRVLSRGQARRTLDVERFKSQMVGVTWQDRDAEHLIDEAPENYKPIDQVMADARDMVAKVNALKQFINYKGVDPVRGKKHKRAAAAVVDEPVTG